MIETIMAIQGETEYTEILQQTVAVIEATRNKVAHAIVGTSNEMHWEIGRILYERKLDGKHGDGIVKRLSSDLKTTYPKMGLSVRNLWDMKRYFTRFHLSDTKLRQAVAVLPWWSINRLISEYGDNDNAILYYAEQTVAKRWNRDLMVNAIKLKMHEHVPSVNISNNFALTLSPTQASYANEVFKDSYCMDFLGVTEPLLELELENRLVEKIKQFKFRKFFKRQIAGCTI